MYIWIKNLNKTFLVVYLYNILVPTIFFEEIFLRLFVTLNMVTNIYPL